MASQLCQHEEPSAVFQCVCSPLSFCPTCLLTHLQTPSGPHTISLAGQPGQFVCGLCKTLSNDPVSCRYPVCLCRQCVATYHMGGELPQYEVLAKEAAAAPEIELKRRAAIPEEALKQRAEGRSDSLQAIMTGKRNDMRQQLMQVMENINSFEEVIARAIYLEEKLLETKNALRQAEGQLAERSAEPHSGRGFDEGQMERFSAMMGRVEPLIRDNERLLSENRLFAERIQTLEKQLVDQTSLSHKIETLSQEVSQLKTELFMSVQKEMQAVTEKSTKQMQETLQDQLEETARVAAQKVSDVIPLVAHLQLDSEWMDAPTVESVFTLASLAISGELRSADMRHVSRVCLLFAKLLGPCSDMAAFSVNMRKVLQKNSERGVALLRDLEAVYAKTKGCRQATDLIKALMRLVGSPKFDDSISIASKFAKVLELEFLCEFTASVTQFFAAETPLLQEWRQALTGISVDWADQQLAVRSLEALAAGIVGSQFSETYLYLTLFVQAGRTHAPTTVLTFAGRAAKLLQHDPPRDRLNAYIQQTLQFLEAIGNHADFRKLAERTFAITKMMNEDATVAEINRLSLLLSEISPNKPNKMVTYRFIDCLPRFATEAKLITFTSGMLAWMFDSPKADFSFANAVLAQLDQSQPFEDFAEAAGIFLSTLSKSQQAAAVERCFIGMSAMRIALARVMVFCSVLLTHFLASPAAREIDLFLQLWFLLLTGHDNPAEITDRVVTAMQAGMSELVHQALKCFAEMKRRNIPTANSFVKEVISALGVQAEQESVRFLLHDLLTVMEQATQPHELAGKAVAVWIRG